MWQVCNTRGWKAFGKLVAFNFTPPNIYMIRPGNTVFRFKENLDLTFYLLLTDYNYRCFCKTELLYSSYKDGFADKFQTTLLRHLKAVNFLAVRLISSFARKLPFWYSPFKGIQFYGFFSLRIEWCYKSSFFYLVKQTFQGTTAHWDQRELKIKHHVLLWTPSW
jgi:hypothetical protein